MLYFAFLLLAAVTHVHVVDEPFEIPARDWRFPDAELRLHQRSANLIADYQVKSGGPVRLLLMTRDDVDRMNEGKRPSLMTSIGPAITASMHYAVKQPGDYALVIDNRGNDQKAVVHLSVWLDFPPVTLISPQRQLTVILLSFAFFFGVVTWSARKLWHGMK